MLVVLMKVEGDDEHGKASQVSAGEGRDKIKTRSNGAILVLKKKRWGEIVVKKRKMLVMVLTEMRSTIEYCGLCM